MPTLRATVRQSRSHHQAWGPKATKLSTNQAGAVRHDESFAEATRVQMQVTHLQPEIRSKSPEVVVPLADPSASRATRQTEVVVFPPLLGTAEGTAAVARNVTASIGP